MCEREISRRQQRRPGVADGSTGGQADAGQPAIAAILVAESVRSSVGQHNRGNHRSDLRTLSNPSNAEVGVYADRAQVRFVGPLHTVGIVKLVKDLVAAV